MVANMPMVETKGTWEICFWIVVFAPGQEHGLCLHINQSKYSVSPREKLTVGKDCFFLLCRTMQTFPLF